MNVIPIDRGRKPPSDPPMPLREAVITEITTFLFHTDPDNKYVQGWVQALVTVLHEAGIPFETWKDELSAVELARLKELYIIWETRQKASKPTARAPDPDRSQGPTAGGSGSF
jgi:hypothetical protein